MPEDATKTLNCGCDVRTYRDFLGRVVATILTRGPGCGRPDHEAGQTIVMPGRENARPE